MLSNIVTLDTIRESPKVKIYLQAANEQMNALGYTEHGFRHAAMVSKMAENLLKDLSYDERTIELGAIAGYMHDIGNSINRNDHSNSAAIMSFTLLNELGMPSNEVATVMGAIGNHEEDHGSPISPVSAALIIADKSDVHHSRVQNPNPITFDIHDRVNFSVQSSSLRVDKAHKSINLELTTDDHSASVMEYFEIFLSRMIMCRRAADYFEHRFRLVINGVEM